MLKYLFLAGFLDLQKIFQMLQAVAKPSHTNPVRHHERDSANDTEGTDCVLCELFFLVG